MLLSVGNLNELHFLAQPVSMGTVAGLNPRRLRHLNFPVLLFSYCTSFLFYYACKGLWRWRINKMDLQSYNKCSFISDLIEENSSGS